MKNKEDTPLVILTGHRKSGTSMFHRLFDGVDGVNLYPPDISILYAYFPYFTSRNSISDSELRDRLVCVVRESIDRILIHNPSAVNIEKFLSIFKIEICNIDLRDKSDVIFSIYNAWIKYQDVGVRSVPFLVKETSQSIFFEQYLNMFPKLKMISLIRDPRDNYAAINAGVDKYYSKMGENAFKSLSSLINRARMDLLSSKINQKKYPESFLAIQFEDLVSDTQTVMNRVANFLEIEFSPAMLKPETNGKIYTGNNFEGSKFSGVSSKNVGMWKERITIESVKTIEYWMGDIMNYWGYTSEFNLTDSQIEFSKFYEKYNCEYFYHDSFKCK